ncbi:hypothetical protein H8959_002929 [Pygathrix nigripes]
MEQGCPDPYKGPQRQPAFRAAAGPHSPPGPDRRSQSLVPPCPPTEWRGAQPLSRRSPGRNPEPCNHTCHPTPFSRSPHFPTRSVGSPPALHLSWAQPPALGGLLAGTGRDRPRAPQPGRASLSGTWLLGFPGPSWEPYSTPLPGGVQQHPQGGARGSPGPRGRGGGVRRARRCGTPYLPAAAARPRANSRQRPWGNFPGRRGALATCPAPAAFPAVAARTGNRGARLRLSLGAPSGDWDRSWGWGSGGLARLRGGSLGATSAPQPGAPRRRRQLHARQPAGPTSAAVRPSPPSRSLLLPKPPPLPSPAAAAAEKRASSAGCPSPPASFGLRLEPRVQALSGVPWAHPLPISPSSASDHLPLCSQALAASEFGIPLRE